MTEGLQKEPCGRCAAMFLPLSLSTCPACMRRICSGCIIKTSAEAESLDPRRSKKESKEDTTTASIVSVCKEECADRCARQLAVRFRQVMSEQHIANVEHFLSTDSTKVFYPRPGQAVTATGATATVKRLAPLALSSMKMLGYGTIAEVGLLCVEGCTIASLVLSPQTKILCERVMPILRRHFFVTNPSESTAQDQEISQSEEEKDDSETTPPANSNSNTSSWWQSTREALSTRSSNKYASEATELALRLYYYGCNTAIERLRLAGDDSMKERRNLASDDLLDRAGCGVHIAASSWLYASRSLRPPHDTNEWGSWYASRLAQRHGYIMIACVGAGRTESALCVPSRPPIPFPAFCLVAHPHHKHAVLAIRGSATRSDWLVNTDSEPLPIFGDKNKTYWVHGGMRTLSIFISYSILYLGMLKAARALLDDCGLRVCLKRLANKNFSIDTTGHSLGAGVATVITALLMNEHRETKFPAPVKCIAYAAPASVDADLAHLLLGSVVSVVHHDDLIPRLSDANCAMLAKALLADDANYHARLTADKQSVKNHIKTLGKVNPMLHTRSDSFLDDNGISTGEENDRKPMKIVQEEHNLRLVPAGDILYLESKDATYSAFSGSYDELADDLGHIVVSSRAVDDHSMPALLSGLRAARWARHRLPVQRQPPIFATAVSADGRHFVPCYCCGSDPAWTSWTTDSDAARCAATHHCRACGQVVCAFCAPAADEIAGDGIGQKQTLPDLRISLPSFGYFEAVRVCRPCAFSAYTL
eukprot:CAMPEP_0197286626 /NCGR_PEP_ID=MMETSP0890-20130614/2158_1 /TAXON_ID=44058 ORGANISM="Aureoumbra lagunensis, Strain CCMP1510" /NCGR_SAMPLE_ID=MMETSP0890 /ASSEMBLY_ACC=CAM_ASM_000533 /LENGTH=762 /DNA_ID=CAMNT_0042755163 /DNA_START=111 /DNA_END=2403 /DNA_ORIENTATION=+